MRNQTPPLTKAISLFVFIFLFTACKPGNSGPKIDMPIDTMIPSVAATDNFLSLSDVHLDSDAGNIYYSRHHHPDTGDSLWHRTKLEIEAQVKNKGPKFMVYLGDLPTHDNSTRVKNVGQMLKNLRNLQVGVPILYLPGNNDALTGDYASFSDLSVSPSGDTTYINPFSIDQDPSNPWPILNHTTTNCKVTDVDYNPQFGFYSCALKTNSSTSPLHVIALNTVIFVRRGGYHTYQPNDGTSQQDAADIQLKWLIRKLDALAASDRVMIMMHIPPGNDGYGGSAMWDDQIYFASNGDSITVQTAFLKEVHDHKNQITSVLTGHTHLDGLRRLLYPGNSSKDMVGLAISTPGITPGHGNNPGFKFFNYDRSNFDLLDFETHYAVPTQTMGGHHHHNGTYKYQGGTYTFSQSYGNQSGSMLDVIKNMKTSTVLNNMKQILKVQNGYYNSFDASALDAQPMKWQKN